MEAKLLMASSSATLSSPHVSSSRPNYLLPLKAMQSNSFACLSSFLPKKPNLSVQAASTSIGSLATKKRVDETDSLTLHSLIRQEERIIFSLLERAQYCHNLPTYEANAFPVDWFHGSLVEHILKETEKLQGQVGRFSSPDEHPFFPDDVPEPVLPPLHYPQGGFLFISPLSASVLFVLPLLCGNGHRCSHFPSGSYFHSEYICPTCKQRSVLFAPVLPVRNSKNIRFRPSHYRYC